MTVRTSHDIAMRVRDRIIEVLPWVADVLVHVEPFPPLLDAHAVSDGQEARRPG